jgi:methionyl-tRNA formyltransferase
VSIQQIAAEMDAGDILAQERVAVGGDETAPQLAARLADVGARMLVAVLDRMARGPVRGAPQDPALATLCRLITKSDGLVAWSESARVIYNRFRAYQPWPGLFTVFRGEHLAIRDCRPAGDAAEAPPGAAPAAPPGAPPAPAPGTVVSMDRAGGLLVQTGAGLLRVTELQLQQKKATDARSFVNGHRDILGALLGGG